MSKAKAGEQRRGSEERLITWGIIALISLMPFHAFIVTWLGSITGHRMIWQAWKEAVLAIMGLAGLIYLWKNKPARAILRQPINALILVYSLLAIVVSLVGGHMGTRSFWYGAVIDLAFLASFIAAQLVATKTLEARISKSIIITSCIVAGFGLLQVFVLPVDFLRHFGYGPTTIEPYRFVDAAVNSVRILSTLGGPNQLGAYLILPVTLFAYLLVPKRRLWAALPLAACIFVQIQSFSRAAWIGSMVAVFATLMVGLSRRWILAAIAVLIVIAGIGYGIGRSAISHNTPLEYYILHGHPLKSGQVIGSDVGRIESLQQGLKNAASHPLGEGLGRSGPASLDSNYANITENYYLQITIETGLLGLLLFLAIQIALGVELANLVSRSDLAAPLFGTLIGIAAVNLFLHGWADSSIALAYWASAGIVVGAHRKPQHV